VESKKRKAVEAKEPSVTAKKKKKTDDASAEPKAPATEKKQQKKATAGDPPATPEDGFKKAIAGYLRKNGPSPLSKLGNECKKPAEVKSKLKSFIASYPDTFKINGMNVKLKK